VTENDHAILKEGNSMARTKQTNQNLAKHIGTVIRANRKVTGMTQGALAETLNLEIETISRMETGKRLPTIEKLLEIADVFRIPVSSFFETFEVSKQQSPSDLYSQKIAAALLKVPESGKAFILDVAHCYADTHLTKPKVARKKTK
jgi:transcriptional regulator with XRE-family HTH domain